MEATPALYLSMASAFVVLRTTVGVKMCDFPETIPMVQTDGTIKCVCDSARLYCGSREDLCRKYACKGNQTLLQDCSCTCPENYKENRHGECMKVNMVRCKDEEVKLSNGQCGRQNTTVSGRNTTEMDKLTSNKSYTTSTRMITTNARTTTESDLPIHTRPEGEQTFTAVPDLSPANNTVNYTEILIPVLVVCGAVLFLLGIISIGKKIWRAYRTRQDARRMQHVYNFGRQESGTKEADGDENNHLLDTRTNGKEQGKNEDIRILIRDEMPSTHIDKKDQTVISDNDHKPSDAELGENKDEAAHEDDKITTVSETGSNTKDSNDHYGYEGDCTNLKKVTDCHLAYIDTGQCNTTQSKTHVGFGQGVIESPRNENLACGPSPSSESPLDKAENGPQLRQYLANPTTRNGIDRNVISGHRRSTVFQPDINEQTDQKLL